MDISRIKHQAMIKAKKEEVKKFNLISLPFPSSFSLCKVSKWSLFWQHFQVAFLESEYESFKIKITHFEGQRVKDLWTKLLKTCFKINLKVVSSKGLEFLFQIIFKEICKTMWDSQLHYARPCVSLGRFADLKEGTTSSEVRYMGLDCLVNSQCIKIDDEHWWMIWGILTMNIWFTIYIQYSFDCLHN